MRLVLYLSKRSKWNKEIVDVIDKHVCAEIQKYNLAHKKTKKLAQTIQ